MKAAWVGTALLLGALSAHAQQTVFMPIVIEVSGNGAVSGTNFRDGALISKNLSTLEVSKAGFERMVYTLAFEQPLVYGLFAVLIAVLAGLAGWYAFRRE